MKDECPDCGCEAHTLREQLNNANEAFAQAIHQRDSLRADYKAAQAVNAPLKRQLVEVRAEIGKYFDVDADDPRTDGGELELADAIHALEAARAILDREPIWWEA